MRRETVAILVDITTNACRSESADAEIEQGQRVRPFSPSAIPALSRSKTRSIINETPESVDAKPILVLRTRFGSDWRVTGNLVGHDVHIHSMSTQGIFSIVLEHER